MVSRKSHDQQPQSYRALAFDSGGRVYCIHVGSVGCRHIEPGIGYSRRQLRSISSPLDASILASLSAGALGTVRVVDLDRYSRARKQTCAHKVGGHPQRVPGTAHKNLRRHSGTDARSPLAVLGMVQDTRPCCAMLERDIW